MDFLEWAALILGVGLIFSGVRAIRRRRTYVPEPAFRLFLEAAN